jgi:tetratricopeptide (TPR) repeat protein
LADGATATMGCVDEPYLNGTPNMTFFFTRWLVGWTFGEAAYASQEVLSWQTTVIGDPLYRPFGKDPRKLHEFLLAEKSPLAVWSHLRVVDLSLSQGVSPAKVVSYIRDADPSAQSAVLTEKLGDLYAMLGEDDLAIKAWQRTLEIHPTLEQGIRVAFKLGDKFIAQGHDGRALDLYDDFLWAHPKYPDALALYKKLQPLAEKAHELDKATRYAQEIEILSAAQNKPVK